MRTAALIIIATLPLPVRAAPCRWQQTDATPLRAIDAGLVVLGRTLHCTGEAHGELQITMTARSGANSRQFKEEKKTIRANGRWPRNIEVVSKGFGPCRLEGISSKKRTLIGAPGDERVAAPITVTAEIKGIGDLSNLAKKHEIQVACPVCPRPSGGVGFYDGRARASRWSKQTRLQIDLDGQWYGCAKRQSTLEVRIFAAKDDAALRTALRPILVIGDLHKKLSKQGKKAALRTAAPLSQLCRLSKGGKGRKFAWELSGRGELPRVGAGGRSTFTIRCE